MEEPVSERQNSDKGVSRSFNSNRILGTEVEEPRTEKTESTSSVSAPVAASMLRSPSRNLSRIMRRSSGNAKRTHSDDVKSYNRFVI